MQARWALGEAAAAPVVPALHPYARSRPAAIAPPHTPHSASLTALRAADEPVQPYDQLDDSTKGLIEAIQERQAYINAGGCLRCGVGGWVDVQGGGR